MLFYYIHIMAWAYDFFLNHLNQIFFECHVLYHVSYTVPYQLKQSTMGKPRF